MSGERSATPSKQDVASKGLQGTKLKGVEGGTPAVTLNLIPRYYP